MSTLSGGGKANEFIFQNDMISQLVANGWLLGKPESYNRKLALYEEDVLGFVKETQATNVNQSSPTLLGSRSHWFQ